jgi:hypothetical protein
MGGSLNHKEYNENVCLNKYGKCYFFLKPPPPNLKSTITKFWIKENENGILLFYV